MTRYVPRLDHAEIIEATRHTHALWGSGRTQAEHTAHNLAQLDHAGPELLRYVGLVDERGLIASMKRYSLRLHANGRVVPTVGVGAVFTRPDARRGGLAATLIRAVTEEARDLGYEAAMLYSDIDPAYYERLGFRALPAIDHVARPADLPVDDVLTTRPVVDADLDRLLAWHEASWPPSAEIARPARTRAIWRYFRWRNRLRGEWILSDAGRDVGYLVAAPDDPLRDLPDPRDPGLFWLDEWSAPGVPAARVLATARRLAEEAGASLIGAWLRPDRLGPSFAAFQPRSRPSALPMIAPLTPAFTFDPARSYLDSLEHF